MLVLGWQVKGLSHWLSILTCRPSIIVVCKGAFPVGWVYKHPINNVRDWHKRLVQEASPPYSISYKWIQ